MNKILLLIVEDELAERTRIKEYLSAECALRYDLMEADCLQGALSLLSHYDFDVVLLDLDLPDSSGLDTARRIITEYSESATIILSGTKNEETARQAVRCGAEDYLTKDALKPLILYKAIYYAINRKRLNQEKFDILCDLVLALEKIEHLESLLPICVGCSKILNDEKHWLNLEEYVAQSSGNMVARPICPECRQEINQECAIPGKSASFRFLLS